MIRNMDETTINKDDIITFLKENPNFFQENPDILETLIPKRARPTKGSVADFQSYMIDRLQADKKEVIKNTQELVENARSNMNNQQRIERAVLRLLEARSFDDFIHCITIDLSSLLGVDISVLVVETEDIKIPHVQQSGIRIVPTGTIDKWMNGKNALLQDNISGIEAIYGGGATLVQSQILLRVDISLSTPPAILAFGSRDPNTFTEGQATDQILFLARVIERCFRNWLDLPSQ